MSTVAAHYSSETPGAYTRVPQHVLHPSLPATIINAPVDEVYRTLTGRVPDADAVSRMYYSPTGVRRAFAILGQTVWVSYKLHAVPGGSQVSPRIDISSSQRSVRALRRAARVAARHVQGDLGRLKDGLE